MKIVDAHWKLEAAGVTALSEFLGFSKSAVYVHLVTLERDGFVVADDGTYRLGLRFLNLGESVKRRQPLYEAADPVIASVQPRWTPRSGPDTGRPSPSRGVALCSGDGP